MADIQPNIAEDEGDAEYNRIKTLIPGLEDDAPVEPEPEEPAAAVVEPAQEAAPAPEVQPETPPEPAAAPAEEPAPEPSSVQRPEKYIPIAKYTSEKKEWKEEKERLEAELTAANASRGQAKDDLIKKYAEDNGVTEESVRDLLALQTSTEPAAPAELDDAIKTQLANAEIVLAERAYTDDFNATAVPTLRELYPDATPAQLDAAKKELEQIACSSEFLSTPLNKVVLASQKELAPLFAAPAAQRNGPEASRSAGAERGNQDYSADDFKGGKTSFEELDALSVEKQTKIIEDMDIPTYEAYSRHQNRIVPTVIKRGERKIEF